MKRLIKALICIILSAVTFLTVFGFGYVDQAPIPTETQVEFPETEHYLVEKGYTPYQILLSATPEMRDITAKDELIEFFREATGLTLTVKYEDATVEYDENVKYLSVGATEMAKELDLVPTYEEVGNNGFVIKTVGASIFMLGYTDYGTLYSVYEFLAYEFDYDFYTEGVYDITKIKADVKTKAYDLVSVPDIASMESNYGYMMTNETTANRLRRMSRENIFVPINGERAVHNSMALLPYSTYGASHPLYYYDAGKTTYDNYEHELCFSAHGDPVQFDSMTTDAFNEIKEEFIDGAKGTMMVIGQRDGGHLCKCDSCVAIANEYGAPSAIHVKFCNAVLEKVYAWFETAEGAEYKREFYLMLLGYEKISDAPVVEENGEYVPAKSNITGESLEVHPRLGIYAALIDADYTVAYELQEEAFEEFVRWKAIANSYAVYAYDTNFPAFFVPFNTFESKVGLYQLLDELGCLSLYDAGQGQDGADFVPTAWSMLKAYLEDKLRWNTDIDVNYYTQKYFEGVYKEAADVMFDTYMSFRARWRYIVAEKANGNITTPIGILKNMVSHTLWPQSLLEGWLENMNEAFDKVEYLKDENPEEYNAVCKMISAERISVLYLLVKLYGDDYSEARTYELKLTFKADVQVTGFSIEGPVEKKISDLLISWGV